MIRTSLLCSAILLAACSSSAPPAPQCEDAGAQLNACTAELSMCTEVCAAGAADAGTQLAACNSTLADAGNQLAACGVTLSTCTASLADSGVQLEACAAIAADAGTQLAACNNTVANCSAGLLDAGTQLVACGNTVASCSAGLLDAGTQLVACGNTVASCSAGLLDAGAQLTTCAVNLDDAGTQLNNCNTTAATCTASLADAGTQLASCGTALTDAGSQLAICQGVACGGPAVNAADDFWFAPPDVSDLNNVPGGEPLYLFLTSAGLAATATISLPANGAFTPIVVTVPANGTARVNLTPFKAQLETRPTNTIANTGLRIQSTAPISAVYEVANTNSPETFVLQGPGGLGTQFYIPLQRHAPFFNEPAFSAPHQAFASFDIVAQQNGTLVTIYSPTPVDGHPANQQFTVTLNAGQTYSVGFTGTNWSQPATHPAGAAVLSTRPIAITIKDDAIHNPSGGCTDLVGAQLRAVNAQGTDYVALKGSINPTGDESVFVLATRNNTQLFLDGSASPIATLFAGEVYRIDMDYLSTSTDIALFVHATQPIYATHYTGFGCKMGMALLPPLGCAGSQRVSFVRSDAQTFVLAITVPTAATGGFTISGAGTATINPASFLPVPGTGGAWSAGRIQFNTTQVPVDSTTVVSNSVAPFSLGTVSGGASTGARYGFHSAYATPRQGP